MSRLQRFFNGASKTKPMSEFAQNASAAYVGIALAGFFGSVLQTSDVCEGTGRNYRACAADYRKYCFIFSVFWPITLPLALISQK